MYTIQFMTTEDVARLLQVPVKTVRMWRYRGTGPQAVKVGRLVRYRPEGVEEWIRANRQEISIVRSQAATR